MPKKKKRPGSAYNRQTHYDILNEVSGLNVKPHPSQRRKKKKKPTGSKKKK